MEPTSPAAPTQPTPQTPSPSTPKVCSGNCGQCLKGGLPMRKELTSFLFLVFFGVSLVLFALLIQAKRADFQKASETPMAGAAPVAASPTPWPMPAARTYASPIALPKPKVTGSMDVENAIATRRSKRVYEKKPVTLAELSQMLWAGQGVTEPKTGKRTVPSARETYPLTLFVAVQNVAGLEPGIYEYLPATHSVGKLPAATIAGFHGSGIQDTAKNAPVVFIISAAYGKSYEKMKAGAVPSGLLEAGHLGQNLYLQAESLGMGTVAMAGFDAKKVGEGIKLDSAETIVYLFPFGHPGVEAAEE